MSGNTPANGKPKRPLVKFLLENRSLMNYFSILMIIYAVWATVEVITNASGASWWPPETGIPASEIYNNPDNIQTINNGWVIGTGAVLGTVGTMIQYFYRAAPYVDASMQATAALIISAVKEDEIQESAEKMAKEIIAAAEEEAPFDPVDEKAETDLDADASEEVVEEVVDEAVEDEPEEAPEEALEINEEESGDASAEVEESAESSAMKKF
tara:strand:+ start:1036 stop:1671 length:636 start_codon:yes stop_codon:yes gene_type:complete